MQGLASGRAGYGSPLYIPDMWLSGVVRCWLAVIGSMEKSSKMLKEFRTNPMVRYIFR